MEKEEKEPVEALRQRQIVEAALKVMQVKDIQIMAWHYYDGLSHRQIGELLKIHKQSVKNRIDKCLLRMAEQGMPMPKQMLHPLQTQPPISISSYLDDNWSDRVVNEVNEVNDENE